ncbi:kinase-like protein [Mollisia scopiformis]|uniref:Kinase-like protein n=1 Tax=Mollisia scopiformis TaxID=149040 RepID=A0A194XCM5_MOLSC|nr:kinase-like protein [Mollisia scopiformis]KUJ17502.1 kinase-like protein [Mollisia scopiformis]
MASRRVHVETLNYRTGGFHPVHLNDVFKKGRYTVIHKLGHGGFATVWLARDSIRQRYVALKILAARLSRDCPEIETLRRLRNSENHEGKTYVMSLLDHFWINGPNGKHLCVVSEVAGTSIKQFNECPGFKSGTRRLRAEVARSVALQAAKGLAFIHFTGTVHGDFTTANILLQIANIDEWSIDQIHERLGFPQTQGLHRVQGANEDTSAPKYTVEAISMKQVDPQWLSDQIMIIDFGISFLEVYSSSDYGTPKSYCAPEFNFDTKRSMKSDIWALGCTIYEIRTGSCLFGYRGQPTRNQILASIVQIMGPLPDLWWDTWDEGRKWYEDSIAQDGQLCKFPQGKLHECIMEIGLRDGDATTSSSKLRNIEIKGDTPPNVDKRKSSTSQMHQVSTSHLVALVEELTTSEAAEVMELVNKPNTESSEDKPQSGSSGEKPNSGSSGEKPNSGSSGEKANSGSSNKNQYGSGSSGSKGTDKTVSSEGLSTGSSHPLGIPLGSITDEGHQKPKTPEQVLSPKPTIDFLEPAGVTISVLEGNDLESLLRETLQFLPEDRPGPAELSAHHWFHDKYGVAVVKLVAPAT